MNGEPLSSAAHSAGFADAAHLTRTSRRMSGSAIGDAGAQTASRGTSEIGLLTVRVSPYVQRVDRCIQERSSRDG